LPELPAIGETGVPGYAAESWYGLSVPAGTPKEIMARLHAETVKAFTLADVRERLDQMGFIGRLSTPEEYAAFQRSEIEKWRKVVKAANMRAD
jgi:tripartite-type tricarboxylate transporter receptor subunit TctC